jgi:hypothetical protein
MDTCCLHIFLDAEPTYLGEVELAHMQHWAWRFQLTVNTTASLPLNEALATRMCVTVQCVTNSIKRFISPKQLLQSPVYLPDMWLLWPARPGVPNDLGSDRMCDGGGRPSLRRTEWDKGGLTSLAASFDLRSMGVMSIPSSTGNRRQSSSATRGSISCVANTITIKRTTYFPTQCSSNLCMWYCFFHSLTWPSLPILTGFPSFQGL